jgi:hypothetical protein
MKKILIIALVAAIVTVTPSCSKFLEQSSQDLVRPVSVTHYKELLQGEAYFKDFYKNGWFVDVMTDDITLVDLGYPSALVNTKLEFSKFAYQWGQDLENPTGTFTDRLFKHLYKNILAANTCLESVDGMDGTVEEKKVLKGQSQFIRAYGYFVLANLYAQAYNESEDNDLSVPLITETTPSLKRYNRATKKEVWDVIKTDIEGAVENLSSDNGFRGIYEINYKAALVLASRIFLFTGDYDKVIDYGERFLLLHPTLKDITGITGSPTTTSTFAGNTFLHPATNPEVVFTFSRFSSNVTEGGYVYFTKETVGLSPFSYGVSSGVESALIDTYGAGDRRKNYFFSQPSGAPGQILTTPMYSPMKVNYYEKSYTTQFMRSGEVYLNLAEAYARKSSPDNNKAIKLLNDLRSKRIASYTNLTSGDFANQQALVNFVWQERRRELCFEEFHRWWDLRRTGQPALVHHWSTEKYQLQAKDPAYLLNFPLSEREFNPDLEPNERPQRDPQ